MDDDAREDGGEVGMVVEILGVGYPIGVVVAAAIVVDRGIFVFVLEDCLVAFVHYYYYYGIGAAINVFVADGSYSAVEYFAEADCFAPIFASVVIGLAYVVDDVVFETDYQT